MMAELIYLDVGRCSYGRTLELQHALVGKVKAAADESAYLVLVEHDPPVITVGKSGKREHILASRRKLAAHGIEIADTGRGGDVTYHGPGQIVGYPILRVDRHGRDVHRYLRDIEEVLIRVLRRFGIEGQRSEGLTGVWVGPEKVAAIGIAIRRWVSYHGFALNVTTDLAHFEKIVPCGIVDKGVTSMARLLGGPIDVGQVKEPLVECMADVFGFDSVGKASPQDI
jgi:lipoate-protein ligase B